MHAQSEYLINILGSGLASFWFFSLFFFFFFLCLCLSCCLSSSSHSSAIWMHNKIMWYIMWQVKVIILTLNTKTCQPSCSEVCTKAFSRCGWRNTLNFFLSWGHISPCNISFACCCSVQCHLNQIELWKFNNNSWTTNTIQSAQLYCILSFKNVKISSESTSLGTVTHALSWIKQLLGIVETSFLLILSMDNYLARSTDGLQ